MTGGLLAEDSQLVGATTATGRAAAATERANVSETEQHSSATFVWTLPETLSSVCAATYSGKKRGGEGWCYFEHIDICVFICVQPIGPVQSFRPLL